MDITLLPPTHILSHHSHLALLPSAFPRRRGQPSSNLIPTPYPRAPFTTYSFKRRVFESSAPLDGSSPISTLPDEILLHIFGLMEWDEILPLRAVNKHWSSLALTPSLHHTLTLTSLPPTPLPTILSDHILPAVRHLHLHLFPYPSTFHPWKRDRPPSDLLELLGAIPPDKLLSLSLPFSAPYLPSADLVEVLERVGGRLEKLDLRGSGLAGSSWIHTLEHLGSKGDGIRELDLGFTSILALPSTWNSLTSLSLASCSHLPTTAMTTYLANLPRSLAQLDLSRLDQVSFNALWDMRVTTPEGDATALSEVKVVGIDHLTRLDIRRLKIHWASQRRLTTSTSDFTTPLVRSPTRSAPIQIPSYRPRTPSPRGFSRSPGSSTSSSAAGNSSPDLRTPPDWSSHTRLLNSYASADKAFVKTSEKTVAGIHVLHSAILESEDEAGYRQFIGDVVGATVGLGGGTAWDPAYGDDGGVYVEIDGGTL